MLSFGALAFANPWLLTALAGLPVLWWLLRVTPPAPRLVRFPAVRLLLRLSQKEETPAHTPLWLLLLRIVIVLLVVLGLAQPLLNPGRALPGSGPLLLVVDDGWAAAPHWQRRLSTMDMLIDHAKRANRPVMLLPTAPPATGDPIAPSKLLRPADARAEAQAMQPRPWPVDRSAALAAVSRLHIEGSANVAWLTDGLAGPGGDEATSKLAAALQRLGRLTVYDVRPGDRARLLLPPQSDPSGLRVVVARAAAGKPDVARVVATTGDGRALARGEVRLGAADTRAATTLAMPLDLRNRVERIAIENEPSAGATMLLDTKWRHRPVGLVSGEEREKDQPLLSGLYYLKRALSPYSEVLEGSVPDLLQHKLAVIVATDAGLATETERKDVAAWIERGGMLIRFAGPRLAAEPDSLVPVKLRRGDRTFGGAMSWTKPLKLAPFDVDSPFAGLKLPDDVRVKRQVLAEPAADLAGKTWARLSDGTPLVTAEQRGKGTLILVHTTANMAWSNLPISGLFVDMLRRMVELSRGIAAQTGELTLPPLEALDGFGRLGSAPATASGISEKIIGKTTPGPGHPPGFYGNDSLRRALNLPPAIRELAPLGPLPGSVVRETYSRPTEVDLRPWLIAAAFLLTLADLVIALALRGLLGWRRAATAAAGLLLATVLQQPLAQAQMPQQGTDAFAVAATTKMHLAYVRTGNPEVDRESRAGLRGLGLVLHERTAVEVADPVEVDPGKTELAFFPLLYWPVTKDQPPLDREETRRLSEYLQHGGMVLFDTRDQGGFGAADGQTLRTLLAGLTIPPLEPVPPNHVLTKAFYLLQRFPGRWAGGRVWVQQNGSDAHDRVSSIIVGGNDWAGAWAIDSAGQPMFPVVPGGEEQRELAYRFGVNVVMYALTGNYKSDQVHVPTILRRLGQ